MKKSLLAAAVLFVVLGLTSPGFSADVAKIGIFDIQKVVDESSAGKMSEKKLREEFEKTQAELQKNKAQVNELRKEIRSQALVLSPEKLQDKQIETEIRINNLNNQQKALMVQFKKLENSLKRKVQTEILKVAVEIGKEEGYLLILESKSAGVFYYQDHLDITDKLIERYNLNVSKKTE